MSILKLNLHFMKYFWIGVLLCSFAFSASAQISGTVTDENNEPLPGVQVIVLNTSFGTVTNTEGKFSINNLPSGNYDLAFKYIGFASQTQKVNTGFGDFQLAIQMKESTEQLGEVVVYAEKRAEEVQKIPSTITAIDAKGVENLQLKNINQIGRITPNFNVLDDGGASFPVISTRGIFTNDQNPIVGIYVDDVPLFNIISLPSLLSDIESIEVLKGPQGSLYGRNALAGVINITTQRPTNTFKGFAKAGYGNFNQYEFAAGISVPIVENKLFMRLSGQTTGRDAYIRNQFNGETNLLDRNVVVGNFHLNYFPSSRLSFSIGSNAEQRKINGGASIGEAVNSTTAQAAEVINLAVNNNPYVTNQNEAGFTTITSINNSFKVGYEGNGFRLDAITAYQYTKMDREGDEFDFTPADILSGNTDQTIHTLSEEIRIRSTNDSKFQWIAGIYLYNVDDNDDADFIFGADSPAGAFGITPLSQVTLADIRQYGFSVFGQADYAITDQLNLTAGIRYELEESFLDTDRSFNINGQDFALPGLFEPATFSANTSFDAVSPKFGLSYQLPNSLIFASMARGYRPGGVNSFGDNETNLTFNPEFSWNYEIGVKNKFWNNRARVNLSAFYINYEDQQISTIVGEQAIGIKSNIGNSKSYGIELESEAILFKGFSVIANVGYLQTEITDFRVNFQASDGSVNELDLAGNEQGMAPEWSGNLTLNYTFDITDNWKFNALLDYQYTGAFYFDVENVLEQPSYALLNGRVSVSNKNFELSFWGQNLSDEVYLSYALHLMGTGLLANYGLPRTYGTSLTYRF